MTRAARAALAAAWPAATAAGQHRADRDCRSCSATTRMVRALNRRWRGRDTPTNVLSFASGEAASAGRPLLLGDVVLAYETVAREAAAQGKTLADHLAPSRRPRRAASSRLRSRDRRARPARMEALERRILAAARRRRSLSRAGGRRWLMRQRAARASGRERRWPLRAHRQLAAHLGRRNGEHSLRDELEELIEEHDERRRSIRTSGACSSTSSSCTRRPPPT